MKTMHDRWQHFRTPTCVHGTCLLHVSRLQYQSDPWSLVVVVLSHSRVSSVSSVGIVGLAVSDLCLIVIDVI